jgi:hypothetical protein
MPTNSGFSDRTALIASVGISRFGKSTFIDSWLQYERERISPPRGHRKYDEILGHIGGLRAGETEPAPPWNEKQEPDNPEWFGFTPYPGARELCHERVDGSDTTGPVGIEWFQDLVLVKFGLWPLAPAAVRLILWARQVGTPGSSS